MNLQLYAITDKNAIFFTIFAARFEKDMTAIRKYTAFLLLILFSCYYCGISMFSHTHIVNGASVVHSHLGGGSDHIHSDSQYAIIDILSHFQTECAVSFYTAGTPFYLLSEVFIGYSTPTYLDGVRSAQTLRGPPQL